MSKTIALTAVAVLFVSAAFSQQPKSQSQRSSVEQCQADVLAWMKSRHTDQVDLTYREIERRKNEMAVCGELDPAFVKDTENDKSPYDLVMFAYALWMGEREQNFLIRHKLVHQFLQEDDAGQR